MAAGTLACLAGRAGPGELAGEAVALLAFTRAVSPAGVSPAPRSVRPRPARPFAPLRLAAALIAAAGPGGTAAAYVGVLPGPGQEFAYHAIGGLLARPRSRANPVGARWRTGCAAHRSAPKAAAATPRGQRSRIWPGRRHGQDQRLLPHGASAQRRAGCSAGDYFGNTVGAEPGGAADSSTFAFTYDDGTNPAHGQQIVAGVPVP